jgi:anti-sigma factor ChrR (cupin superfamily)
MGIKQHIEHISIRDGTREDRHEIEGGRGVQLNDRYDQSKVMACSQSVFAMLDVPGKTARAPPTPF